MKKLGAEDHRLQRGHRARLSRSAVPAGCRTANSERCRDRQIVKPAALRICGGIESRTRFPAPRPTRACPWRSVTAAIPEAGSCHDLDEIPVDRRDARRSLCSGALKPPSLLPAQASVNASPSVKPISPSPASSWFKFSTEPAVACTVTRAPGMALA